MASIAVHVYRGIVTVRERIRLERWDRRDALRFAILASYVLLDGLNVIYSLRPDRITKIAWEYSEYLINYSGGFLRRGLIGTVVGHGDASVTAISVLILGLHVMAAAGLSLMLWRLRRHITLTQTFTFLLLPGGFLSGALVGGFFARKEFLGYVAFLAFLVMLSKVCELHRRGALSPRIFAAFLAATSVLNVVLVLSHEAVALVPVALMCGCLLVLMRYLGRTRQIVVVIAAAITPALVAWILSVAAKGNSQQALAVWQSLDPSVRERLYPHHDGPAGGIEAIGWSLGSALEKSRSLVSSSQVMLWCVAIPLVALAHVLCGRPSYVRVRSALSVERASLYRWSLRVGLATVTCSALPLFALGFDWGRWTSIACNLGLLFFLGMTILFAHDERAREEAIRRPDVSQHALRFGVIAALAVSLTIRFPGCCYVGLSLFQGNLAWISGKVLLKILRSLT